MGIGINIDSHRTVISNMLYTFQHVKTLCIDASCAGYISLSLVSCTVSNNITLLMQLLN
jgi:hypothetical protein